MTTGTSNGVNQRNKSVTHVLIQYKRLDKVFWRPIMRKWKQWLLKRRKIFFHISRPPTGWTFPVFTPLLPLPVKQDWLGGLVDRKDVEKPWKIYKKLSNLQTQGGFSLKNAKLNMPRREISTGFFFRKIQGNTEHIQISFINRLLYYKEFRQIMCLT